MKISTSECFILEDQLKKVIDELRESKVKSLSLNVSIKRNLEKAAKLCADFRMEIREFMPEALKQLIEKKDGLSEEETKEKVALEEQYNAEINKFLQNPIEFNVFNCGVSLTALKDIELTFDTANIIDLLFGEQEEVKE